MENEAFQVRITAGCWRVALQFGGGMLAHGMLAQLVDCPGHILSNANHRSWKDDLI